MPHIKLRFSSQLGHPDLLYSQEWVNVIFLHLWPQKLYRAFRFGTLWRISCSYPRHSQLTRHSLMLANGRIRQSPTALVEFFINKILSCRLLFIVTNLYEIYTLNFQIFLPYLISNVSIDWITLVTTLGDELQCNDLQGYFFNQLQNIFGIFRLQTAILDIVVTSHECQGVLV